MKRNRRNETDKYVPIDFLIAKNVISESIKERRLLGNLASRPHYSSEISNKFSPVSFSLLQNDSAIRFMNY